VPASQATANNFGSGVIDIFDYANTNKNKTGKGILGYDSNGSGNIYINGFAWYKTEAINTITLTHQATTGGALAANSQFALYGVK